MVSRRDSQALAMGTDGRFYWSAARQPDYGWSAWKALPALEQPAYPATLSLDKQGRTHVFASNLQGQLFSDLSAKMIRNGRPGKRFRSLPSAADWLLS